MAQTDPQLGIRLPGDLKERIRKLADTERRSMNGQIVVLLERALQAPKMKQGEAA